MSHIERYVNYELGIPGQIRLYMRSYFSSHLLASAADLAEAARSIEEAHTGRSRFDLRHRGYVLASILASFNFLESMINELFQDAHDGHAPDGSGVGTLGLETRKLMRAYWNALGRGEKGGVLEKYDALLQFAERPDLDKGAEPYQCVWLIVKLRNTVVHYKPELLAADESADMEKRLRGKFADNPLMTWSNNPWWPDKCLGWGCANWALHGVTALADHVVGETGAKPNYAQLRASGWLGAVPGAS